MFVPIIRHVFFTNTSQVLNMFPSNTCLLKPFKQNIKMWPKRFAEKHIGGFEIKLVE